MKTLKRILVTALIAITAIACTDKKEDYPEQLPKATQTGENTAGCYVNGKLWIMRGKKVFNSIRNESSVLSIPSEETPFYSLNIHIEDQFFNEGVSNKNSNFPIDLFVSDSVIIKTKSYILSKATGNKSNEGAGYLFDEAAFTDDKNTGTLTITKLVTTGKKPFIAGTFEFTAVNSKNEIFKITNGRFDLELNKILQ